MASKSYRVTVGTDPVLIWQTSSGTTPDPEPVPPTTPPQKIWRAGSFNDPRPIICKALGTLYTGGETVTVTTGLPWATGESLTFNVNGNDSLYAVASTTTSMAVQVMRV
jgi:hypothetical protein